MSPHQNNTSNTVFYQRFHSPLGAIYIAADKQFLRVLAITEQWNRLRDQLKAFSGQIKEKEQPILLKTKQQLDEYFSGKRICFELPLHLTGTAFQKAAWNALLEIPYGETRSYSEQATAIKNPKAVRAIGRANGQNPISIVVPCHRVVGKSGNLTGYASGLDHKAYLIELEKKARLGDKL